MPAPAAKWRRLKPSGPGPARLTGLQLLDRGAPGVSSAGWIHSLARAPCRRRLLRAAETSLALLLAARALGAGRLPAACWR